MRILVTGGAGFIGSHVTDALIAGGHEVTVADNLSTGSKKNVNPRARFVKCDVAGARLASVLKKGSFDVVYHLAAQINVRSSVDDPMTDAHTNILGSINVLEACRRAGVTSCIFASSGGACYGNDAVCPTPETSETCSVSPYGIAKRSVELYMDYYSRVHGMRCVSLRYANVYGPRQNVKGEAGVVAIFCDRLRRGKAVTINGTGEQTRDYVYVGDVVDANLRALDERVQGIFNVGTGVETSVNELYRRLKAIFPKAPAALHDEARLGEQQRSCLATDSIRRATGWRPTVVLEDGLKLTAQWFEQQP